MRDTQLYRYRVTFPDGEGMELSATSAWSAIERLREVTPWRANEHIDCIALPPLSPINQ